MCISKDVLIEIVSNSVKKSRKSILRKINNDVAERSFYCDIIAGLISELEKKDLSNYFIDSEYNRAFGFDGKHKAVGIYDEKKRTVEKIKNNTFDIVVHLDGIGDIVYPENLIHIEVKKNKSRWGRNKDKQRLLSTTRFSDKLSTRYLGVVFEPDHFEALYNTYSGHCQKRAEQIELEKQLDDIKEVNKKIFSQYKLSNPREWVSNIIAGYQLGAFIDIGEDKISIEYYWNGNLLREEEILYE